MPFLMSHSHTRNENSSGRVLLLLWFLMLGGLLTGRGFDPILASSAPQSAAVGGVKTCLIADFNGNEIFLKNRCGETVEVTWFFGSGHQGFASLASGGSATTGVSAPEIPQLGSLRFFACPIANPVFLAPDGGFLSSPNPDFRCGVAAPSNWDGKGPHIFSYDLLTSGDCVLEKGTLAFNSSGEGRWIAKVHTNHTTNRDIWHISFDVLDERGRPLFSASVGDSPAMYGSPSPVIPWAVMFSFDKSTFRSIAHITVRSSC